MSGFFSPLLKDEDVTTTGRRRRSRKLYVFTIEGFFILFEETHDLREKFFGGRKFKGNNSQRSTHKR